MVQEVDPLEYWPAVHDGLSAVGSREALNATDTLLEASQTYPAIGALLNIIKEEHERGEKEVKKPSFSLRRFAKRFFKQRS